MTFTCKHLIIRSALLAPVLFTPAASVAQDQPAAPTTGETIGQTRAALQAWREVSETIAKEKAQWALGKEVMLDRIELMKRNIEKVQKDIKAKQEELDGFDTNVKELQAKNEQLKQASDELENLVEQMEQRTLALLKRAPKPLVTQVKPLAVQIPGYLSEKKPDQTVPQTSEPAADAAGTGLASDASGDTADSAAEEKKPEVPLSRRAETAVGVLYLFNKFASKIEQAPDLIEQPDGTTLSVDTIYLGLSYGFYVDDPGSNGAVGTAGQEAWVWKQNNDAATLIQRAISVYNKDEPAAYVSLPVEVK